MSLTAYVILFFFGLAVGSFFNVVSFRYKTSENVFSRKNLSGRSKCLHCTKKLNWFELIPLFSFLIQRGRCRTCHKKLSWQYPIVELLAGFVFVAVPLYFQKFYAVLDALPLESSLRSYYGFLIVWMLVFLVWLLISVIDSRYYVVPNGLNLTLGILGVIITAIKTLPSNWLLPFHTSFLRHYELIFTPFQNPLWNHLLGAAAGAAFFGFLVLVSRGRAIGLGDVKLALASGLILGWPDIGLAIIFAFVLGGAWGAYLLLSRQRSMHDKIPFAPIFVLGAVLTIFFGFEIVKHYFGLFGI